MTTTRPMKTFLVSLLSCAMIFAPLTGCSDSSGNATAVPEGASGIGDVSAAAPAVDDSFLGSTWRTITETTESGLVLVSSKCSEGSQLVMDASQTAYIWSADTTCDGWDWIRTHAGEATEWASDTADSAWAMTRQTSGEFSLWVRVQTDSGVAWARTAIPEAWNVTKDATGQAWVWIDEHRVEVAVAAAVVAIVVAGLIVAPEGVAPAVVRGAVGGSATEAGKLLVAMWKTRDQVEGGEAAQDLPRDLFVQIGRSVIMACGSQVVGSLTDGVGA